jgi:hypothetical protein
VCERFIDESRQPESSCEQGRWSSIVRGIEPSSMVEGSL